ncbi:Membrane-associated guanylate kinase, WW and PDZ domain-containing protein 2, partial [Pteropus alecto]
FFSHINRRTQFENPVLEAKRKLQQHNMPHTELGTKPLQAPGFRGFAQNQLGLLEQEECIQKRLDDLGFLFI